jgi:hypothetical protein
MDLAAAPLPTEDKFNEDFQDHSGSEIIRTEARLLAFRLSDADISPPTYVAIPFADLKAVTRRPRRFGN